MTLIVSFSWGNCHLVVFCLSKFDVISRNLRFLITWLLTSMNDTPNTYMNLFSGQQTVLTQKRGECRYKLWYVMYRVLGLYLCIKIHIWSLFQHHWIYLVIAVYIYLLLILYILYIMNIRYHSLEKREMSRTRDAGRIVIMVEISGKWPVPLLMSIKLFSVCTFARVCTVAPGCYVAKVSTAAKSESRIVISHSSVFL